MKATLMCLAIVLGLSIAAPAARAGGPGCTPQAPDACGPGYFNAGPCGMVYGPNYWLYPCYPPWQGAVFGPKLCLGPNGAPYVMGPQGPLPLSALPALIQAGPGGPAGPGAPPPGFVNHPFARSPRDFFMQYE
jgi:hypothetical protein